jgi:hypothetical protein
MVVQAVMSVVSRSGSSYSGMTPCRMSVSPGVKGIAVLNVRQ